jgi:hypothetical protein
MSNDFVDIATKWDKIDNIIDLSKAFPQIRAFYPVVMKLVDLLFDVKHVTATSSHLMHQIEEV